VPKKCQNSAVVIVKIVFNTEDAKVFAEDAGKCFPVRSFANASEPFAFKS